LVDSLKALDPERPIREADMASASTQSGGVGYRLTRGLDGQFQRASEALRLEVKMSLA
jgi:hypothetical protein